MINFLFLIVAILIIAITVVWLITLSKTSKHCNELVIAQITNEKCRPEEVPIVMEQLFQAKPDVIAANQIGNEFVETEGRRYYLSLFGQRIFEPRVRATNTVNGDSMGILGGYVECTNDSNATFLNRDTYELSNVELFLGNNECTIIKSVAFEKFKHKKNGFVVYNCSQKVLDDDYFSDTSYTNILTMFRHIEKDQEQLRIPYIISGSFGAHNWDVIRKHVFGDAVWSSGKFRICTVNNQGGLAAPDGIIVHKSLTRGIEYGVRHYAPFKCDGHYVLFAKLSNLFGGERIDEFTVKNTNYLKTLNVENNFISSIKQPDIKTIESENVLLSDSRVNTSAHVSLELLLQHILDRADAEVDSEKN